MRADLFVYISGPMSPTPGHSIEQNIAEGLEVYLDLLQRGIPAFCPHLSGIFPSAWTALNHADWLSYDCCIVSRCTHVFAMARWQESAGAKIEVAYARNRGIPVIEDVEDLL